MPNEAENAIYTRLASAPVFHPSSADLFVSDWAVEAGDVVSVVSGDETYSVPVYSLNLEWNAANGGESKAEIQATGNQKREPLPALRRRQYGGGSSTHNEIKRFQTEVINYESDTDAKLGLVVKEVVGGYEVNSAGIVAAINDSGSGVTIWGDKVDIAANQQYSTTVGNLNTGIANLTLTTQGLQTSVTGLDGRVSTVEQTAEGLQISVSKKSSVYPQYTDPKRDADKTVQNGDIWEKDSGMRLWSDVGQNNWNVVDDYKWKEFRGSEQYVYKDGQWLLSSSEADFVVTAEEFHNTIESNTGDISTLKQTAKGLTSEVENSKGEISAIRQTADSVSIEVANARGDNATLSARLQVTDTAISTEVTNRTNADETMQSSINQTANSISAIVTAVGSNGTVTAASIVAAINNSGSSVAISAEKILLNGQSIVKGGNQLSAASAYFPELNAGANSLEVGNNSCVVNSPLTSTVSISTPVITSTDGIKVGTVTTAATWRSAQVVALANLTAGYYFAYSSSPGMDPTERQYGRLASGTTTIYYLGRANA